MILKQPDLGKKIAELRKAQGFTQEELVEKCKVSVRTLQRIESGEVEPRSYTIKVIFAALDYRVFDTSEQSLKKAGRSVFFKAERLKQLFRPVAELFNLKTNTMKKLAILSVPAIAAAVILLAISIDGNAQSASKVRKVIERSNQDYVRWFNSGDIESFLTLYRDDACLVADGCGLAFIRDYFQSQMSVFKFEEVSLISLSVCDSIAVEKGRWTIRFDSGDLVKGEHLTEWRRTGKKWQIVNDISKTY